MNIQLKPLKCCLLRALPAGALAEAGVVQWQNVSFLPKQFEQGESLFRDPVNNERIAGVVQW